MKKLIPSLVLPTFAIFALVGSSFAAGPAKKDPKSIACAVETGNKVNIAEATKKHMYADYKGNRYFFCCDGCPQEFKKDPAKFAKNAHIKTPVAIKKVKKANA